MVLLLFYLIHSPFPQSLSIKGSKISCREPLVSETFIKWGHRVSFNDRSQEEICSQNPLIHLLKKYSDIHLFLTWDLFSAMKSLEVLTKLRFIMH